MAPTFDRERIVERHWPYDGPHDAEAITSAGEAVAELPRYLSNATLTRRGVLAPDLYVLLGTLDESLGSLRQLTRQLGQSVEGYSQDTALRTDRDPTDHARAQLAAKHAGRALHRLLARLVDLHAVLDDARGHLAHLYHDTDQHVGR